MCKIFTLEKKSMKKQNDFMMKIGLIFCLVLMFSSTAYSQKYRVVQQGLVPENLDQMNKPLKAGSSIDNLFKSIEGTYQIECLKADYKVLLSESLYQKIISSRKEDQDVYVQLDEHSRLFLPSNTSIKLLGFKKLDTISYTSK
jgi:hypothetical protein